MDDRPYIDMLDTDPDPRTDALAEALAKTFPVPESYAEWLSMTKRTYASDAAAILAALPPDWCGHDNRDREDEAWFMQKEIDRLRPIEEAALALLDHELDERGQVLEVEDNTLHLALRAALEDR